MVRNLSRLGDRGRISRVGNPACPSRRDEWERPRDSENEDETSTRPQTANDPHEERGENREIR